MSRDVVFELYRISSNRAKDALWIDDVFVTGILASDLNIVPTDLAKSVVNDEEHVNQWLESDKLTLPPMFGPPNIETAKITLLWNKTFHYYQSRLNYSFSDNI